MGETRAGTPPFGDYVLSFSGKFLKDIRRDVSVRQAESFAVLGAEIDEVILDLTFHPVDISIKVEGKPCEPKSFLRVKLASVFGTYSVETRLGPAGFGIFESIPIGTYLAAIVDGERIRAVQPVETWGPITKVKVSLPLCG